MKRLLHKIMCLFDLHAWTFILGEQSIKYRCTRCGKEDRPLYGFAMWRIVWRPFRIWNTLKGRDGLIKKLIGRVCCVFGRHWWAQRIIGEKTIKFQCGHCKCERYTSTWDDPGFKGDNDIKELKTN